MRMIGYISTETAARTLSDFLYVQGIHNQVEMERGSGWAIWVHGEDEVEKARGFLQEFLRAPHARKFIEAGPAAEQRREADAKFAETADKRVFSADRIFTQPVILGMTALTAALVGLCVIVWLLQLTPKFGPLVEKALFISNYYVGNTPLQRLTDGLLEIKHGQIWRLVTPILMHERNLRFLSFLHLLFNMLWLKDLGTLVEVRRGPWFLIIFVVLAGAISNLCEHAMSVRQFYGMSGVVYALLGYVWMKGKLDPGSGFFLPPSIVSMMLIWLLFGYTSILPMANGAHTFGLVVGMVWGIASAMWKR